MINLQKRDDITPICPHCEKPNHSIGYREIKAQFGKRYIYFCGSCHKTLGVSHRKGFWMG